GGLGPHRGGPPRRSCPPRGVARRPGAGAVGGGGPGRRRPRRRGDRPGPTAPRARPLAACRLPPLVYDRPCGNHAFRAFPFGIDASVVSRNIGRGEPLLAGICGSPWPPPTSLALSAGEGRFGPLRP